MKQHTGERQRLPTATDAEVRLLHETLLGRWNRRDAEGFARLFEEDGIVVGFDGSQMNGRQNIASELGRIFADHPTAAYVGKIRSVRSLAANVAVLQAVVGMVPPGQSDVNAAVNAVQTLVAVRQREDWQIAVFQNTPAAYHGRPEMVQALTDELREVLRTAGAGESDRHQIPTETRSFNRRGRTGVWPTTPCLMPDPGRDQPLKHSVIRAPWVGRRQGAE